MKRQENLKLRPFEAIFETYGQKLTPGLAPSVTKISSGFAGYPSRAAIPAAMSSRQTVTPCKEHAYLRQLNFPLEALKRNYTTKIRLQEVGRK